MSVGPGYVLRDRFTLEEQVRRSRLGPIYRAVDNELSANADVPHHVAVQLLPSELAEDERLLLRFKRDFVAMQSWSHPNIARIFSFERDQGQYFLTMEYLEGETLRGILDELEDERLSIDEVLAIVSGVGNALGYAHSKGVVHSAVAAENVFITSDYVVKLINFAPAEASRGEMLAGSVDKRDDVRGLACLMYELAAGHHPFAARGRQPTPARPARLPGLTRRQWKALERALAPNRDQRFSSVSAFTAELGLRGNERLPGGAPPQTDAEAREPAAAGRRWGLAGLAAALVLGLAGVAYVNHERVNELMQSSRETLQGAVRGLAARPGREEVVDAPDVAPGRGAEDRGGAAADSPAPEQAEGASAAESVEEASNAGVTPSGAADEPANAAPPPAPAQAAEAPEAVADMRSSSAAAGSASGAGPSGAAAAAQAPSPGRFSLATERLTVRESQGVAAVVIERLGGGAGPATVVWWTSDGSAVADEDYIDLGARVERFEDGETSRTVHIPLVVDAIPGEDKTFYVHIEEESGAALGPISRTSVLIIDDS
jgi:hypothetical protein